MKKPAKLKLLQAFLVTLTVQNSNQLLEDLKILNNVQSCIPANSSKQQD
jgi:hypothetical protein